ncbi:hypothetical protein LAZ67_15000474 [Cordylochernes scorpioides]|uniref:Gag-Pol-p199 n=1 Tax=Cordylochernes scorpioides TaxID=51811 RepID=A0ABY6L977_9ARAC|nr:hypothetical protein LAZ67_15000474 [Cordylochernes scorpioides]
MISYSKERLTILNDRLILIDDKIKEILLDDPRSTEAQINDEMELCETYSLQVGIVAQKVKEYESKLAAPCDDKMSQFSTSDVKRQIKLPKFELKKYTGELEEWLSWWSHFEKIHLDESLSDVDKFEYLIQSMVVGSKAHRLVTSFPLTQKNYNKVIGDLKDRFGDRDMLTELYVRKLLKLVIDSARSEKRTLAQLYDDLVAHLHSLGSLGVDTKSGGGAFLYPLVESSLPLELIKIWQRSRTPYIEAGIENSGAKAFDKLEGLIEFLKQEVKNAERISFVAEGFEPSLPLKQGKRENNPPKIHTASALFVGKTNLPCLFCDKDNHLSQNCFKAAKMLESDRLKRVQDAKVCFKCLRKNHLKKDCRSFVRCKRCQGPHFEIMCRGTSHSQEDLNWRSDNRSHNSLAEQNEGNNEPVTAMANQVCTNNISLMTLIVKLKGPKRSKMVRVLLDSGSQKSYIRRSLAKELDLPKVGEVKLNKFLFGGQTTGEKAHSIFYFQLDNVDEGKAFKMEALEETIICGNISPVETGPRQWELDKKGITLTKVDNNNPEIDILIGGDYYGQLLTGKIEQLAGGLTAIQTVLGWTLIGNTSSEKPETSAQMVITLLTTQQRVASLWELETIGIRDPTEVISVKEKNVLMQEKFREKICRGHDGRYLVSLPWKEGIGTIPNNLEIAKRRLEAVTQKLTQKGQFVPYDEVFRSWFRENLIEEVDREDIRPTGHYLPHRPIYKVQSEATPIRPVYDASCKASKRSLSLNECLETGPNLIELLPEILIRFREKKIGAIADIRKAFQTVGIDEKERFHKEYLAMLVQKRNETEGRRFLPGEVVLIGRDDQKRIFWPLGRILELYPGKDGRERVARVRTATGEFVRPLKRLFSLELGSDISREVRLPKTEGIKAQEIPTDGEQSIFTRLWAQECANKIASGKNISKMLSLFQIEKLNSENYETWKMQMKMILIHSELWEYANSIRIKPETEVESNEWEKNDQKALATIVLSLSPSEIIHVKRCKTSAEAWKLLNEVHQPKGPATKVFLTKQLILLKMKPNERMQDYLNKFSSLADKLSEMDAQVPEDFLSILPLCSLPESYEGFRTAIETRDKLPNFEALKVKMLEEAIRQTELNDTTDSEEKVFLGNTERKPFSSTSKPKAKGFPFNCHFCGKKGHKAADCRKRKSRNPKNEMVASLGIECLNKLDANEWCLDSGATAHMCSTKKSFTYFEDTAPVKITLADGQFIEAIGKGNVKLECQTNTGTVTLSLEDVLFVPRLNGNLFTISKCTSKFNVVNFKYRKAEIVNMRTKICIQAYEKKGLYMLSQTNCPKALLTEICIAGEKNYEKWHSRFGHLNLQDLKKLKMQNIVYGLPIFDVKNFTCEVCLKGKQTRLPFQKESFTKTREPLELVHSDICGPMRTKSLGGALYFSTFIDDFSGFIFTFIMKSRSEVFKGFRIFKNYAEKQTGKRLKCIRNDNAPEYLSKEFKDYLEGEGIGRQLSVEYTPQQNGVAERANRTLLDMTRCFMIEGDLPETLWAELIHTSTYIRNRCPKLNECKTPHELFTKRKPVVSHLKIIGSKSFAVNNRPNRSKFAPRSEEYKLIGYFTESKAYRLWKPGTRTIIKSSDVRFIEPELSKIRNEVVEIDVGSERASFKEIPLVEERRSTSEIEPKAEIESQSYIEVSEVLNEPSESGVIISRRGRGRPRYIRTGKPGRPRKEYPTANLSTQELLEAKYLPDPKDAEEALSGRDSYFWKKAMEEEFDSLIENKIWELVDPPKNRNIIGTKWVFKTKCNSDGSVERHKARLVAKGYSQQYGIDYEETFAPVVRQNTIRMFLALAVEYNLILHQMDVQSAYLNGEIKEEIFMTQPENFVSRKYPERVCRLKKAIYGLKQAGIVWHEKLDTELKNLGLKQLQSDNCVYIKHDEGILLVAIYVDDLIIAAEREDTLKSFKEMSTRPVIAYAVSALGQFSNDPRRQHWNAAKRVLRYLKGTSCLRITYRKSNEALHGYVDADWGGNLVDRKSHTRIVYFLARGPIAWESKKQQTVTLSSTESEYIALCGAGKEAVYLRALLDGMGFGELLNGPTVLKTDNQGAQQLARNPVYHARTKHIDIKWHFIRSICSDGLVEVVHTPTQENVADILTKGLPRFLYEKHVTGFGM